MLWRVKEPPGFPPWFVAVALAGLALRVLLVVQYAGSPFAREPLGDERYYWIWAGEIAAGHWRPEGAFYQAPLFPYLLAAVKSLAPGLGQVALAAGQVVLNWVTCLLLVPLVSAWAGRATALKAATLALFFSPGAFYALKGLPTTIGLFLLGAALTVLSSARRRELLGPAAGGVLAGLSLLAVPSFLPALPGIALLCALAVPAALRPRALLLLALGGASVVLPVTLHNYAADGSIALISSNAGMSFAAGNNGNADGTYAGLDGISTVAAQERLDAERMAGSAAGRPVNQGEVSRYFFRRGLDYIREHPLPWLALELRKAGLLLAGLDVPLEFSLARERRDFLPLLWAFPLNGTAILLLAALAPGAPATLRQLRPLLLLGSLLGSVCLVFSVSGRYAFPAYFILVPVAAAGLEALASRRWSRLTMLPAAVIGAALAFAFPALSGPSWECDDYLAKLAGVYDRQDRPLEALETYRRWFEQAPDSPFLHRRLAEFYLRHGQPLEAGEHARVFHSLSPRDPASARLLARALADGGRTDEAVRVLEGSLAGGVADVATRFLLADLHDQAGRREEARAAVEEVLREDPGSAEARRRLDALAGP